MNHNDAMEIIGMYKEKIDEKKLKSSFLDWELNCDITNQDWLSKIDGYYWSHLIGWITHSFYFKDWTMFWIWSFGTEIIERSFQP